MALYAKSKRADLARWMEERRLELERRAEYDGLISQWDANSTAWEGEIPRVGDKPWESASEYNPPLTFSKVQDLFSILHGYVSGLTFFRVKPAEMGSVAAQVIMQRADNWDHLLKNRLRTTINWSGFCHDFVHDGILHGHGFGEVGYERLERTAETEIFLPDELREADMGDKRLLEAALADQLRSRLIPSKGGFVAEFKDEDRIEKTGFFRVERNHPHRPEGEASVIVKRMATVYDGVRLRNIHPWDIIVPPSAVDLQSAKMYFVRRFLSIFEIRRMMDSGLFNQMSREDFAVLEERWKTQTKRGRLASVSNVGTAGSWPYDRVNSRLDSSGQFGNVLESRRDEFECWFEYTFDDIDDDGYEESAVRAYINTQALPMFAMEHRIEKLYPHGRRPHFDWKLIPVSGRYYGKGLGQLLWGAQLEENHYYQKRSDVVEIVSNPGGFYDPNSGLMPDEIRWTPGMMIKADLSRQVYQNLTFGADPGHLLREQSGIDMQSERAVGSTDMGLGRSSGRPNAPRTLGGTAIAVRQQQLRTDTYTTLLIGGHGPNPGGIGEGLMQIQALMAAFMPPEVEFQLVGTDEMRKESRENMAGRFLFELDYSEENNNPQMQLQNAVLAYDRSIGNPLIAQDPGSLWHVTTRMLEAAGMKDAKSWVRKPEGVGDRPNLPPEEVLRVLAKGVALRPNPTENHGAMATAIMDLLQNPDMLSMAGFTPTTIPLLERYAQETMQFMLAGQAGPVGDQRIKRQSQQNGAMGAQISQEQVASPIGGGGDGAL